METSLDKLKDEITEKVIAQLENIRYMTKTQKQLYSSALRSNVKSKLLATTVREQSGLTNADDYNQTAFELYLDMLTTFNYVNELYNTISSHQILNESIINTLHSTIAELNDKLDEYEAVIGTAGSPKCFIEGFRTQNSMETDKSYFTERYGEIMPLSTYVKFNTEQENISGKWIHIQIILYDGTAAISSFS